MVKSFRKRIPFLRTYIGILWSVSVTYKSVRDKSMPVYATLDHFFESALVVTEAGLLWLQTSIQFSISVHNVGVHWKMHSSWSLFSHPCFHLPGTLSWKLSSGPNS